MSPAVDLLLVGSMPFATVEEVLRRCCGAFGDALGWMPDGEVGDRRNWTEFLPLHTFASHPDLEEVRRPPGGRIPLFPEQEIAPGDRQNLEGLTWHFRMKPGTLDLAFPDLQYAKVAEKSYAVFRRLRDEGTIPAHVRFQANFPASSSAIEEYFCDPRDWEAVKRAYEAAVRAEIVRLLEVIPTSDLAVQFDFSNEVVDLSMGVRAAQPWLPEQNVEEKWARHTASFSELGRDLPEEALLGYHWCYGTWGGWPRTSMTDLGLCVELSNAAVAQSGRRVDYVHMPVPRHPDEVVFAPLRDFNIGDTRVFLGLIHHEGSVEDLRTRLSMARAVLDNFGIAGPCGYGRVHSEELPAILTAHRDSLAVLRAERAEGRMN